MIRLKVIMTVLTVATMWTASCMAHKESLFMEATALPALEHTYMSGDMIKSMGAVSFNSKKLRVDCKDLKSYDIIETSHATSRDELWKVMKKVIKKEKLDRLAGTRTVRTRTSILGKLNKKGDTFSKLMLVEQGPGHRLYILYLTGKIKCVDLNLNIGSLSMNNTEQNDVCGEMIKGNYTGHKNKSKSHRGRNVGLLGDIYIIR